MDCFEDLFDPGSYNKRLQQASTLAVYLVHLVYYSFQPLNGNNEVAIQDTHNPLYLWLYFVTILLRIDVVSWLFIKQG